MVSGILGRSGPMPAKSSLIFITNFQASYWKKSSVLFLQKLRTVLWQWAGDALTEEEFVVLDLATNVIDSHATSLSAHLTVAEIEATRMRINTLRSGGIMPLPSEDWPAIPWPAY